MSKLPTDGLSQKLLLVFTGLVIGVFGTILFLRYFDQILSQQTSSPALNSNKTNWNVCLEYSHDMPKDRFLREYTVKAGDSLLSIATKELGNPNRVNEIIYLNLSKFPVTVSPSPLLEVGWVLYLPPVDLEASSGYLKGVQGKVTNIEGSHIVLTFDEETNRLYGDKYYVPYDSGIKNLPKVGDCITAIIDTTNIGGKNPRALKIMFQE